MSTTAAKYLDRFIWAYVACALWSSNDESTPQGGEPLDNNYDSSDIAPEALGKMTEDCKAFIDANKADLEGLDPSQCGHDFWLNRNGHGSGFWDRGYGDVGERLKDASHKFKECNLYVGDDGKIYMM